MFPAKKYAMDVALIDFLIKLIRISGWVIRRLGNIHTGKFEFTGGGGGPWQGAWNIKKLGMQPSQQRTWLRRLRGFAKSPDGGAHIERPLELNAGCVLEGKAEDDLRSILIDRPSVPFCSRSSEDGGDKDKHLRYGYIIRMRTGYLCTWPAVSRKRRSRK